VNELNLVAINLTRRCNLNCEHCYLDATTLKEESENELSTAEAKSILDEVFALNPEAMVVLTGGEPLLRNDLEEIVQHGSQLGLFIVAGTNGIQLTSKRVQSLKNMGLMGVGVSLDSTDPVKHDNFRGKKGCWEKTIKGLKNCAEEGLSFQVHFTVTQWNIGEIDDMIALSENLGARVVNIFFLICTGRGETVSELSPLQYESALEDIVRAQSRYADMIIRPRCAPHFKRVAMHQNPDADINRISGREGDGCLAGIHYCRITPEGEVTACPYIDTPVGSIRSQSLAKIWNESAQFNLLRNPELEGKCGVCEYRSLCGGCRARPVAQGKNIMASDTLCDFEPQGKPLITNLPESATASISWDHVALTRLNKIPGFIRKMVKRRAEAYVLEREESIVEVHHLEELTARRFGNNKPGSTMLIKRTGGAKNRII
jgi:radical SAM protein with 4Fe4S-binding SPASM domain